MHAAMLTSTLAAGLLTAFGAVAQAVVGQPAPAFSAVDTSGKTVSLADYKGKHVVLEWVNPGCPFVQKHYNSGNMPATQKAAVAQGVEKILDRFAGEQCGVRTDLARRQMCVAGPENGEPVLAGRLAERKEPVIEQHQPNRVRTGLGGKLRRGEPHEHRDFFRIEVESGGRAWE